MIPGYSWEVGVVNYIEYKICKKDFVSFRTEYMNDDSGERTGFATEYMGFTLGLTHQFNELIEVRPEIRYEWAFRGKPYDLGRKSNQTTFLVDAIGRF